jgi:hypothetical protein
LKNKKKKPYPAVYGVSPRGNLILWRKVKYEAELAACRLAGKSITPECSIVDLWRRSILGDDVELFEPLKTAVKVARAARLLRASRKPIRGKLLPSQREERHLWLSLIVVPGQDDIDKPSWHPGVLEVIVGPTPYGYAGDGRVSIDILFARQEMLSRADGLSDGASFGAIGVRVGDRHGRVRGLVIWNQNRHAEDLYHLTVWGKDDVRHLARRALRREARRVLNAVQRLRERDAAKKAEQRGQVQAQAE